MIKKNTTDEKLLKRLLRIQKATDMLSMRYNELDYLIKTQTLKTVQEKFDLKELIEKRIDFLKQIYPQTKFITNLEEKTIINDPIGLSKVIDNLIDNAIKYSPKNSKIIIKLKHNDLTIQDFGKGIDEVELVKIFDNYYQENNATKGFGIGLYMVKKFCDNNDIKLLIQSEVGIGTTVKLKFKG